MKNNYLITLSLIFTAVFSLVFWNTVITGESFGVQKAEAIQYCMNYHWEVSSDTGVDAYLGGGSPILEIKSGYLP